VRVAVAAGEIVDPRAADFFPTPRALADRLVELAQIEPGQLVLEPSAGRGAIADAVRRRHPSVNVRCFELLADNVAELTKLGIAATRANFLEVGPEPVFDRVIMNPPFSKRADIFHVRHAIRFLKPGGRLVSVMSAGVEFRSDHLSCAFRDFVAGARGRIERNPGGSFLESGTAVRTVTVIIGG